MADPRPPAPPSDAETPRRDLEQAARDLGRHADRLEQSKSAPKTPDEGVGPLSGVVP